MRFPTLSILILTSHLAAAPADREPPPVPLAKKDAEKLVRSRYKADFAKARRSVEAQRTLAKELFDAARQANESAAVRFVLLHKARDLSVTAGDLAGALRAVETINARFRVDGLELRLETLAAAKKAIKTRAASGSLADAYLDLSHDAVTADEYDLAAKAAKSASTAAKRSGDRTRAVGAERERKRVKTIASEFKKLRSSITKLAEDPDDGPANRAVGRFVYAIKGQPRAALDYLSRSSDELLARIVRGERDSPKNANDQLELGDVIWDVGERESGLAQDGFQARAGEWYARAFARTPLVDQERIRPRLTAALPDSPEWLREAVCVLTFDRRTVSKSGSTPSLVDLAPRQPRVRVVGSTPWKAHKGIAGEAYRCGGRDDSIILPDLRDLLGAKPAQVTVGLWARSDWKAGFHCLFDLGNCGPHSLTLASSGTDFRFLFSGQHVAKAQETEPSWRHLVGTWDGKKLSLFVDGELAAEAAAPDLASKDPLFSEEPARIGTQAKDYLREGRHFQGLVDEVFVLPRALDASEILRTYARGLCGKPLARK